MSNHINFIKSHGINTLMKMENLSREGLPFHYCYACAWGGSSDNFETDTSTGQAVCPKCWQPELELNPEEGTQLLLMIEDIKNVWRHGGKGGIISRLNYLYDNYKQDTKEFKDLASLKARIKPIRLLL
jgi:hypothetical protein